MGMKKARFSRAAYDNQQLERKQLLQDRHSLFIGPDGELAARRNHDIISVAERPVHTA